MSVALVLGTVAVVGTVAGGVMNYNANKAAADTAKEVGDYNAQMATAVGEANAVQIEETAKYNISQLQSTATYNANRTLQVSEYNARAGETAARTNAQRMLDVGEYNAVAKMEAAKVNSDRILEVTDYNARMTELAANYNWDMAQNNAEMADMTARETINRMRKEGGKVMSTQTARYARAGVVADTGTPLEMMAETAGIIELNAMDEKRKGDIQSTQILQQGKMDRFMAYKEAEATRYFGQKEAWETTNLADREAAAERYFSQQEADNAVKLADMDAAAQRYFGAQEAGQELDAAEKDAAAMAYLSALQAYNTRYTGGLSAGAELMYGSASARGYKSAATGSLVSGITNVAKLGYGFTTG